MFYLIFGILWTVIISVVSFGFYGNTGGTITVNGEIVSQSEFNGMIGPKLFFGAFFAVGIFFIIKGIRKILEDGRTEAYGEETFAQLIDLFPTGFFINGIPEIKGVFCVYMPLENTTEIINEVVRFDNALIYPIGSFFIVKYFNGDINIQKKISVGEIPNEIKEKLDNDILSKEYLEKNSGVIMIDGVKYKKVEEQKKTE